MFVEQAVVKLAWNLLFLIVFTLSLLFARAVTIEIICIGYLLEKGDGVYKGACYG